MLSDDHYAPNVEVLKYLGGPVIRRDRMQPLELKCMQCHIISAFCPKDNAANDRPIQ